MTYNETVKTASGDPFVVLTIGDKVRLAEKEVSSDASVLKFSYAVTNSDLDDNGIGITATTGLSKSEFTLSGTYTKDDTITVSGASGAFKIPATTNSSNAATQLLQFLKYR